MRWSGGPFYNHNFCIIPYVDIKKKNFGRKQYPNLIDTTFAVTSLTESCPAGGLQLVDIKAGHRHSRSAYEVQNSLFKYGLWASNFGINETCAIFKTSKYLHYWLTTVVLDTLNLHFYAEPLHDLSVRKWRPLIATGTRLPARIDHKVSQG